jgi:hypothetical protein
MKKCGCRAPPFLACSLNEGGWSALPPWKESPILMQQEVEWAPETVWTVWGKEKFFPWRESNPGRSASSPLLYRLIFLYMFNIGICGRQNAVGQVFSEYFSSLAKTVHSTDLSILTITRGRYNRPGMAAMPSGPSMDSTPLPQCANMVNIGICWSDNIVACFPHAVTVEAIETSKGTQ